MFTVRIPLFTSVLLYIPEFLFLFSVKTGMTGISIVRLRLGDASNPPKEKENPKIQRLTSFRNKARSKLKKIPV